MIVWEKEQRYTNTRSTYSNKNDGNLRVPLEIAFHWLAENVRCHRIVQCYLLYKDHGAREAVGGKEQDECPVDDLCGHSKLQHIHHHSYQV